MIRTILVVGTTFLYIFLVGGPAVLIAALTGRTRILYLVGRFGARMAFWMGGMTVEVHGREKADPARTYIYVVNHESIIDPVVVFTAIPHDAAALGKKEFFRLPVLGRACLMTGFIPVERQNPEQRVKAASEALEWIRDRGKSYIVFPEGTRSSDGRLRAFKKGAAIMAIGAKVEVLPIAVHGGYGLWPKGRWYFKPGHLQMHFLDPIPTAGMTQDDKDRLTLLLRERIADRLRQIDPTLQLDDEPQGE